jgi:hypothetical protein
MESQGANLLPSRAPLLEPVARGGGVTTYKLISPGRSTVVFTVAQAPLGTSPRCVAVQHQAQCQWCIPWRLEARALGVAATLCSQRRREQSRLGCRRRPATIVEVEGRTLLKKFNCKRLLQLKGGLFGWVFRGGLKGGAQGGAQGRAFGLGVPRGGSRAGSRAGFLAPEPR